MQYQFDTVLFFGDAFVSAAYLSGLALMVLLGFRLGTDPVSRKQVVKVFVAAFLIAAVLSVGLAVYQWLGLPETLWVAVLPPGARPYANLAQPNQLATLLCISLAGLLYLHEKRITPALVTSLLAVPILFGVALTQSRTAFLGIVLAALAMVHIRTRIEFRLKMVVVLLWIGLYISFFLAVPYWSSLLAVDAGLALRGFDSSGRIGLWLQLVQSLRGGGLWGYGWAQVPVAQMMTIGLFDTALVTEYAHNLILDILIWNGPIVGSAVLIYFCFIGFWLFRGINDLESAFCIMALLFLVVHAMLEFPLNYAYFLLPAGLMLGIGLAGCHFSSGIEVSKHFVKVVCVLAFSLLLVTGRDYFIIEEEFRVMRMNMARIAGTAKPLVSDVIFLTQLRSHIDFFAVPIHKEMSAETIENMRKVVLRFPSPASIVRYSIALAINGREPEAAEHLMAVRSLYGNEYFRWAVEETVRLSEEHGMTSSLLSLVEKAPDI